MLHTCWSEFHILQTSLVKFTYGSCIAYKSYLCYISPWLMCHMVHTRTCTSLVTNIAWSKFLMLHTSPDQSSRCCIHRLDKFPRLLTSLVKGPVVKVPNIAYNFSKKNAMPLTQPRTALYHNLHDAILISSNIKYCRYSKICQICQTGKVFYIGVYKLHSVLKDVT